MRHKKGTIKKIEYIDGNVEKELNLNSVNIFVKNPTNIRKIILNPILYMNISISGSLVLSLRSLSNTIPGTNVK